MQAYTRRRAFAAVSLAVLCAAPAVVALYLYYHSALPPVQIGHKMPPLPAMSVDGQPFVRDTSNGKKSLLVFFAPGCSHCRAELTNLDELLPEFKEKLDILGVSVDNLESTRALAAQMDLKFPVVIADHEQLEKNLKVTIIPAFFCIDEFGVLRDYYTGEHSLAVDEHLIEGFISSANVP
ncbi:MAG: TlpA disulfide reductase family protein [Bacteroidota bacterium]